MTKSEDRMTNQIRMTNGGGRQSGVRDLRSQASSLKPAVEAAGKAGWGAGERTRKPEPGTRKKGAKGRGPEMPVAGNRKTEISIASPEFPLTCSSRFG